MSRQLFPYQQATMAKAHTTSNVMKTRHKPSTCSPGFSPTVTVKTLDNSQQAQEMSSVEYHLLEVERFSQLPASETKCTSNKYIRFLLASELRNSFHNTDRSKPNKNLLQKKS